MTHRLLASIALSSLLIALAACGPVVESSNAAAQNTKEAFSDAASKWKDLFTYHPKGPSQLPQTRYCYQQQTDIVCYDSLQAGNTAKLVGYQDGGNIAWVQPGGGSLGYSGAPATSVYPEGNIQPLGSAVAVSKANTASSGTVVTDEIDVRSVPDAR